MDRNWPSTSRAVSTTHHNAVGTGHANVFFTLHKVTWRCRRQGCLFTFLCSRDILGHKLGQDTTHSQWYIEMSYSYPPIHAWQTRCMGESCDYTLQERNVYRQGHRKFPPRNWKIPPAQYQNSRKCPFLKYSKTSHQRTFRSVNSSIFAGFSRTAFCRTSNGNFFYNQTSHINKQKAVYSFITNMSGMHKRWTSVRRTVG